jgi:hypothetical protein
MAETIDPILVPSCLLHASEARNPKYEESLKTEKGRQNQQTSLLRYGK